MNQCTNVGYKEADDELNRVYMKIKQVYKEDTVFLDKLKKAQLVWIQLRDADLELKYPHSDNNGYYGSALPMCMSQYKTSLTLKRVAFLKKWLTGLEEGDVCAGSIMNQLMPSLANAQNTPLAKPWPDAFVCSTPDTPCSTPIGDDFFAPYDLSFNLPNPLKWQTAHNSNHFYAIILKSSKAIYPSNRDDDTKCGGYFSEKERLSVQAMFPYRKVFASRHNCGIVQYNNVNNQYNFLAVYAGKTSGEANKILKRVKATGHFTDVNIRKMQVVVYYGELD